MVERERIGTTTDDRWERLGALTGIGAVVLWIIGVLVLELGAGSPDEDASPEQLLSYFQEDSGAILAGGFIFQLGCLLFFWFLGSLRSRLLRAEGGVGRLTATAFAGGVATAIFLLLLPGPEQSGALSEDELTPSTADALWNMGDMFFIGAELASAVLLVATALLALRGLALPRWLAWVSLLVALVLLIPPIGWAALIFAMPVWVLVTSFLLWRSPGVGEDDTRAAAVSNP